MKRFVPILLVCALCLTSLHVKPALSQVATGGADVKAEDTLAHSEKGGAVLKSLQTAYYAETHERALYVEFAKKADDEGYHQVASMFRAIARAEEIHAANKAALITEMGGVPQDNSEPLLVGSTKENLEFATASETYEEKTMYAGFIDQARKDKDKAAEQTFVYAQAAEPGHLMIFQQALNDLQSYKGDSVPFLVCPHCGKVVRTLRSSTCPVCGTAREKFETVR